MKKKHTIDEGPQYVEFFDDSKLLIGARFRGASGKRAMIDISSNKSKGTAVSILETISDLAYKNVKESFDVSGSGKAELVSSTGVKKVAKSQVAKAGKEPVLGAK